MLSKEISSAAVEDNYGDCFWLCRAFASEVFYIEKFICFLDLCSVDDDLRDIDHARLFLGMGDDTV